MEAIESTRLIWLAAGEPEPCDTQGRVIEPARRGEVTPCGRCGDPEGHYTVRQLISSNFVPVRNANRIQAYGGVRYCAACIFSARTLRLRCVSWFASVDGIQFWSTRQPKDGDPIDPLLTLLTPPDPPFVVGIPAYGIQHGGEGVQEAHGIPNWQRSWWPGEEMHDTPLIRLQAKHVALYSRTAYSRDRYPVQVDDDTDFLLDREVWLRVRDDAYRLMRVLVDGGVPVWRAKRALQDLVLPDRVSLAAARCWPKLTRPLEPYASAVWWPTFCWLIKPLNQRDS